MRPRRSHKKSRNGCSRCKGRHVKCDETRPSCLNCVTAELQCDYCKPSSASTVPPAPASDQQTVSSATPDIISFTPQSELSTFSTPPILDPLHYATGSVTVEASPVTNTQDALRQPFCQSGVNMLHMELLHHVLSVTCKEFQTYEKSATAFLDVAIKHSIGAPYIMHEILAIGALHLSILRPQQHEFYHIQAVELQASALSLFNSLPHGVTAENPTPAFLFSSLLGVHVLYDTLLYRPSDFSLFVERFVSYLRLHHGAYSIAKDPWGSSGGPMQDTELEPLLGKGRNPNHARGEYGGGWADCAALKSLMQSADLSQSSIKTCLQALEDLQWVFDSIQNDELADSSTYSGRVDRIFVWPIVISPDFTDLLSQRRPEALAILAHYAVLLHYRRNSWFIKDGGRYLIEAIMKYLGPYWTPWLSLPISVLEAESNE